MNFLFDSNVILDYLIPTNTFHLDASKIIRLVFDGTINGYVSSHSLRDIFYILSLLKTDANFYFC